LINIINKRERKDLDTFPLITIGSLEQILDENWFPEYGCNHHGKDD
jgi:hypothetical protein